ncbi:MAG: LacI family DNA-binding transcriptional regulator [Eubacterium sp.]|nr:LacI family DNA-binding transcriptional regulator [Eubacterium sp.]
MATMEDIARKLSLSKGTVSKALSGAADISEATRRAVLETAVELGYSRLPRSGRSRRMCIMIEHMAYQRPDDFGSEMILGFRKLAEPGGFHVDVINFPEELQDTCSYDTYMLRENYCGAFFLGIGSKEPWMKEFETCRTPTVLYDCPTYGNPYVTSVGTDNLEGMNLAVAWLKELGHRTIGYLGGEPRSYVFGVRHAAFFQAMHSNGLKPQRSLTGTAYRASVCLERHFERLYKGGCTAVICSHDLLADALLTYCTESGIRVPEDLSIIGIDDIPLCQHTNPPLATIRQNRLDLGKSAYYALYSQLSGVPLSTLQLHAELMKRESAGPVNAARIIPSNVEASEKGEPNDSKLVK